MNSPTQLFLKKEIFAERKIEENLIYEDIFDSFDKENGLKENETNKENLKYSSKMRKNKKKHRTPLQNISNLPILSHNDEEESEGSQEKLTKMSQNNRIKKSNFQVSYLKKCFQENNVWSKSKIEEISRCTSLKHTQVYKWYWDQKLKQQKHENERKSKSQPFDLNQKSTVFVATHIFIPASLQNNEEIIQFLK